eukprot:8307234-Lingulodinium_polyedra.AAC.1
MRCAILRIYVTTWVNPSKGATNWFCCSWATPTARNNMKRTPGIAMSNPTRRLARSLKPSIR